MPSQGTDLDPPMGQDQVLSPFGLEVSSATIESNSVDPSAKAKRFERVQRKHLTPISAHRLSPDQAPERTPACLSSASAHRALGQVAAVVPDRAFFRQTS